MPKFRVGISANQWIQNEVIIEAENEAAATDMVYAKFNEFRDTNGLYHWAENIGSYWDHSCHALSGAQIDYVEDEYNEEV